MASASASAQAPPAAPPAAPVAVTAPTGTKNQRVEREQNDAAPAGGIGRRSIRLVAMLPRKIGGVALRLLGKKTKQQQQQFGGLKDVVSYSSRRMAAGRALEYELSSEGGALFLDPLAAALAG